LKNILNNFHDVAAAAAVVVVDVVVVLIKLFDC